LAETPGAFFYGSPSTLAICHRCWRNINGYVNRRQNIEHFDRLIMLRLS
jgi:hypothetical protein